MNNNSDKNQNSYANLGQQIKDIVSDAVGGQDYEQLNKNITRTVNSALAEARDGIRKGLDASARAARSGRNWEFKTKPTQEARQFRTRPTAYEEQNRTQQQTTAEPKPVYQNPNHPAIPLGRVNNVASYALIGGGISGLSIFTVLLIFGSVMAVIFSKPAAFVIAFGLVGMAGSGILLGMGLNRKNFIKRYRTYLRVLKDRKFCELKEFAQGVQRKTKDVVKDLKKMIKMGLFPEGHIDEHQSQFIGSRETYEQYLLAKQSLEQRMEEEKKSKEALENMDEDAKAVREAVEQGRNFIKEIREANDMIPGEVISRKLDETEFIVDKIFDRIEERPDQLPEIRKFMQYYLPTTKRLIRAYKDFDAQPVQTDTIQKSKGEIEKTLDTINTAFYNLYNSLFQDEAMDVASDISVLHAMFAQEGLTKKDFTLEEEKNE
ncbi:MAG: 5-bromo-4-chloroindolyl phosphate hydrolysis family protein [Lachnospiraceae bacterium]|nr:5-bromo-4-chloroindolyl phosphate hydrolysis family protein [Lachnospiraceae bacterium]